MKMSFRRTAHRTFQFIRPFNVHVTKKSAKENTALNLIVHSTQVKALVFFIETYQKQVTNG